MSAPRRAGRDVRRFHRRGQRVHAYGGKYQLTETQSMVAKLPVLAGKTDTVTMMSYGFDPYLSSWSPYHGAVYAVVSSVAKIVAQAVTIRRSVLPSRSTSAG